MVRICRIRQLKVYDWSTGSVFGKVGTRRLPGRRNENAPSPIVLFILRCLIVELSGRREIVFDLRPC
jgi:hypothetical protein